MIDFSVVVLPAPLRPSSVTTSPSRTSKLTPCRMCDSPYQACRSLTASRACARQACPTPMIGFAHFRIVRDRRVVALGEHAPAREHGDAVGEIGHHRQIVLDHQHGAVGGDALDQLRDALDVLVTHARGRLVEQQHFRIERQRGGDLERALAAIGQFDRGPVGELRQARRRRSAPCARSLNWSSAAVERQKSNEPPRLRCSAMRTFSSTRHMREHGGDLERAHQAEPRHLGRRQRGDVAAVDRECARASG